MITKHSITYCIHDGFFSSTMKKALFIDCDGTLVVGSQADSLEKLEFYPKVFRNLYFIRRNLDFDLVLLAKQVREKTLKTFAGEDIHFDKIITDTEPETWNLKPETWNDYDLSSSFLIGSRLADMQFAKELGCKYILLNESRLLDQAADLKECCALATTDWDSVAELLRAGERTATVQRKTKETDIVVSLNLDGNGDCDISTGLGFFDHLLEQIGKHSGMNLNIRTIGDLHVDEHHTIEDTAIALGEALHAALGSKRGIERYGYCLPMDDCLCSVALDFGGRPWLVWDATYRREKVGDMPAEMFMHFFKSLSDAARMNLNIKAEGTNEHHKIEGTFKAFARTLKMAIRRDIYHFELPSTKGVL